MARKLTRKQKIKMNPNGSGNSKYAQKITQRAKFARKRGFEGDTPWPVIWATNN
ncbi:hypothetical protein LCGC14_1189670 [marine sediment metagenome]|uniref:Uncharacterized protein n=1 Tax=marine sediment metagenome TaxID=412755 RepID=A0A0F9M7J8_9ZZZZ